jgi:hypothetical protein
LAEDGGGATPSTTLRRPESPGSDASNAFLLNVGRGTISDGFSFSIDAPPRSPNGRSFGGFLLGRKQHHFRVATLMNCSAVFIKFASFQFDRLEANTAKQRFLSRHSAKPPQRFLESSSENIMGCEKSRFQENTA